MLGATVCMVIMIIASVHSLTQLANKHLHQENFIL
jgi:hypothetical protein